MRLNNKSLLKSTIIVSIVLSSLFIILHPISSSYTKQDFVINNDSKVLLDLESDLYYNGSISVTVTTGVSINATVNGVKKEIALDETKTFEISNSSTVYFVLSSYGYSQGFFELELDIDPDSTGGNPITTTIGILAAFILIISVASYYLRARKIAKENEEDEELDDPETVRKKKEAAGAEKKFWGLDDK